MNHLFLPTSEREKTSLRLNSVFFDLLCILLIEPSWLLIYVYMVWCMSVVYAGCVTLSANPGKSLESHESTPVGWLSTGWTGQCSVWHVLTDCGLGS